MAEEVIDSYLHDLDGSGYYVLVAELDSAVAGFICYGPTPLCQGTWDVYWEVVDREQQGHGIGGALMEAAATEMGKAGARLAFIETSSTPAYDKARRFHTAHGYEVVAHLPDFYQPGDDKLILQKRFKGKQTGKQGD